MEKKNLKQFIEKLGDMFPEIKEELLDEDIAGLTALQIDCFTRFTQHTINNYDTDTVSKCFQFVDHEIDIVEF
jgi:hypothetical protein